MADINHAELSRELALALGYYPESVRVPFGAICEVFRTAKPKHYLDPTREWNEPSDTWQTFDYTAPDVVLPLLEWLGNQRIFFWRPTGNLWVTSHPINGEYINADTLAAAVARACIAVRGVK